MRQHSGSFVGHPSPTRIGAAVKGEALAKGSVRGYSTALRFSTSSRILAARAQDSRYSGFGPFSRSRGNSGTAAPSPRGSEAPKLIPASLSCSTTLPRPMWAV